MGLIVTDQYIFMFIIKFIKTNDGFCVHNRTVKQIANTEREREDTNFTKIACEQIFKLKQIKKNKKKRKQIFQLKKEKKRNS